MSKKQDIFDQMLERDRSDIRRKQTVNILTCDPSFTAWGWAVITPDNTIIDQGVIITKPTSVKARIRKSDDRCRRVSEIVEQLISVLNTYSIKAIVSEAPHGSQSAVAAIMLGACLALLQTLADTTDTPLEWISEEESKKHILRKRSATKQEMIDAVDKLLKVRWTHVKFRDEAVADALAVFLTAKKISPTIKMLCK